MTLKIFPYELQFSFARSSGPGGQNVNKVNSKAILHWHLMASASIKEDVKARFFKKFEGFINNEGYVVLSCDSYRDQVRNKQGCIDRLTEMVKSVLHPPKKRIPTKPSTSQKYRRLDNKKSQSKKKSDRRRVSDKDY